MSWIILGSVKKEKKNVNSYNTLVIANTNQTHVVAPVDCLVTFNF